MLYHELLTSINESLSRPTVTLWVHPRLGETVLLPDLVTGWQGEVRFEESECHVPCRQRALGPTAEFSVPAVDPRFCALLLLLQPWFCS